MGNHTVDHMQQGPIQCAQQNNQTGHKNYEFKKVCGGRKKKKERIETWNAFLLRFQNINLSNKPLDSFQKFHLTTYGLSVELKINHRII